MTASGSRSFQRWALVLAVLACRPASAGAPQVPTASGPPVAVSLAEAEGGAVRVEGRFTAAASPVSAWRVLTDYEHIADFVPSMRLSRVTGRAAGFLFVEQEFSSRLLLFERVFHVLLKVHEEPHRSISFEDVSGASFRQYTGAWLLRDAPGGIEVTYQLTAKSNTAAPAFVMRAESRKMVADLLSRVRRQISLGAAP